MRAQGKVQWLPAVAAAAVMSYPVTGVAADVASSYPNRPIRYILPNAPGSNADLFARVIAKHLGDTLGQQVIVDSRPGAGGMLGIEIASKATPDGYTIARGNLPSLAVAPHVYKKMPYDALTDLVPVSLTDKGQNLLVVHPSVPASSVKELIALLKAKPEQYSMASAGIGSASHLAGALFTTMVGVSPLHVPYKSAGASTLSLIGNESQWAFTPIGAPLPHVRSGKLRALAVSEDKRAPQLPDVPTAAEAGVPGYYSTTWAGIVVPKGTPEPIVAKLNAAIVKVLNSPEVKQQFINQGGEAAPTTPEEFGRFIRTDYERIGKLAKVVKLSAD
jgi:tripartite-type tricarboxylate transporter receptor subunit TctC